MANKKTSTKQKKSQKKSTKSLKVGGMKFATFSPSEDLASNPKLVIQGMIEALMEGDKEAFQEILAGYVRAKNISQVAKQMHLSRTVIYEALDKNKNPGLATLCKIMVSFKGSQSARVQKAA